MKRNSTRQQIRRAILLISFLLFPIFMNYLSPYVIIDGASQGMASGSMLVFGALFVSGLLVGRLWCGWLCPAGGLGDICTMINDRPVNGKKIDWIKWAIWFIWMGVIIAMIISVGGLKSVNFTLDTVNGISVAGDAHRPIIAAYVIYYVVIGIFLTLSLAQGRRGGCHTICWMAPFLSIGRFISNALNLPALRLKAEASTCTSCKVCNRNCPMSLDVNAMVQKGVMENKECILCGSCVDGCPAKSIRYAIATRTGK